MPDIPSDHPRHDSLLTRKKIEKGIEKGITGKQGLIAQGRGEAFDYLLGEKTIDSAFNAERAAVACMLLADKPVISVNGNVAALCPEYTVELADIVQGEIEVNIFYRTEKREKNIAEHLKKHGAKNVKGRKSNAEIPGLSSERAKVDKDGIYSADVVLIPLEDGDRCEALVEMGKTEIVIDLNPLSRSARKANIPIIDNINRAFPNMIEITKNLKNKKDKHLEKILEKFDKTETLSDAEQKIRKQNKVSN